MLHSSIGFSIRNKLLVGLLTVGMVIYGIIELARLPIDAVPDITNNQVQVITLAPSFGAEDIERLVTFPIEQANNNIKGLKEIRSFSRFGLSLVTIVFDDATDIYWARLQVAERLQKVQAIIPPGIGNPELGPISTGLGEIYQYVVRPKKGFENKYDETELRTLQDWIVRRQLLGVKGVAEVSSFGGKLKQYSIEVDPARLQSFGITIHDVFAALETNNQNTGGAYIEKGPSVLYIRSEGLVGGIEDIRNISIKTQQNGNPLFIRDVAQVVIGHATRYGAMCYNDEGEVAGAVVMMLKGANSSEVIKNVKKRIALIQKTLPEGVVIEPFLDRTKMVNNAIGTVKRNLAEGALIVVLVLVIFLGNLRAGLLVASVIPLSMLFAVIMMNIFGVSGNLMSLGAIDFGLIVDGAVIIVEAVMHQLSHNRQFKHLSKLHHAQMDETVQKSAGKMMSSAVFGQIIILVVYLPIFTLEGIEGKMFKPMAQTVAFALLGAFILSVTYIPMMSAFFLSRMIRHAPNWSDKVMTRLEKLYERSLKLALGIPKTVLALTVGLFLTAVLILSRMGGEFIPVLEEGDFAIDTRVLTGSSLTTTIQHTQQAAHILKTRFPEVEKVVTKIGSGEVPTDPMPMEASDLMVILKDKSQWTSAKTFSELAEKMGTALQEVPGITTGFQFPVQMRFNELMTGARQDVVCKIFGEDLDTLAQYAARLGNIINSVEGAKNLYVEAVAGMPQILISYNRATIAQYGLNIADINRVVNAAFAGQQAGMVFEGEKRFDLVVRLSGEVRRDLKDVQQLLVPTPRGSQVPLYMLADVQIKDGPNQIQREDAKRRIVVGFNVRGRDVESIVHELQQKVDKQLKLPAGYYVTYGGAFENLNAAKDRLMIAVPLSLLLIFILLFFAFNSIRHGLLIYSAIPLSATGGIFFLALRGMPFSISAGVGFIALFGVAVLNGIVLIAEFNRLKLEGDTDIRHLVLKGTRVRLRPVLMTAMVASLGFLPMAISNGAGAEVQRPLATVVIGGLLIATFLTLMVLPVLYILFEKRFEKKQRMKTPPTASLLLIGLLAATLTSTAQQVTLRQSLDTALARNGMLQQERGRAKYQQALVQTATQLPAMAFNLEAGQYNSVYTDTRIGISQGFALPVFYRRQRNFLQEEAKAGNLYAGWQEKELCRLVEESFYAIRYIDAKLLLLQSVDSLYKGFLDRARLRLDKGESAVLEKTLAEQQWMQAKLQLEQAQADREIALIRFRQLLNSSAPLEPAPGNDPPPVALPDTTRMEAHPRLQYLGQQCAIAAAAVEAEKARLLPEFNLGISNTSIRGIGADDKFYPASRRFTWAQAGIMLPVFSKGQRKKVEAARMNTALAEQAYQYERQQFSAAYQSALAAYRKALGTVQRYEKEGLPNARLLQATAGRQLAAGNIQYLEWAVIIHQALMVQNDYTEALHNLHIAAIRLRYFQIP